MTGDESPLFDALRGGGAPFPAYKTGALFKLLRLVSYHFIRWFSIFAAAGIRTRKIRKYVVEAIWPMIIKGCSTGCPPIQVRIIMFEINNQNRICDGGRNMFPRCLEAWSSGTTIKIRIEKSRAKTPPSLFGIDRRMAYAKRKYHSGLICGGVTRGFAGVKFSGSPRRFGENRASRSNSKSSKVAPSRSLYEKYGWNGTLSVFEGRPVGLFDPVSWRNSRWSMDAPITANGRRKWNVKNRVSVALSTEKPPQIHSTRVVPM